MSWTTSDLLTSVKLRCFWDTNAPLSDAELLTLANDELQSDVFPLLLSSQGGFRLADLDHSITADQQLYKLPPRAHGGRLYDVLYVDSNGRETSLPMQEMEELGHIYTEGGVESPGSMLWFLKDDYVGLYPTPTTTRDTLRLRYYMRPGTMVTVASAAQITAVTSTTLTFASGTIPTAWTTTNTFDVISDTGTFRNIEIDKTSNTITTTSMTWTTLDSGVQVGDWVALAKESPLPQIPEALHPYLYQKVAVRALQSAGDREGWRDAIAELEKMEDRVKDLMSPRVDGETKSIVPRYAPIRNSGARWTRWTR